MHTRSLDASELTVAMQAIIAAAKQLASAVTRIVEAVQTQHGQRNYIHN
jgi:hypothetical protein